MVGWVLPKFKESLRLIKKKKKKNGNDYFTENGRHVKFFM